MLYYYIIFYLIYSVPWFHPRTIILYIYNIILYKGIIPHLKEKKIHYTPIVRLFVFCAFRPALVKLCCIFGLLKYILLVHVV